MKPLWWLQKLAKNPAGIGSVAPSSPFLGKLMTRDLKPGMKVLELGPGDGAVTQFILDKLGPEPRLTLFEHDPDLAAICRQKFPGILVRQGDAEELFRQAAGGFDAIVSGIPFAAMEKTKRARIFSQIKAALVPGGVYVMFQYSTTTLRELCQIFPEVKVSFTPLNLPPAFVFTCRDKAAAGS